MRRFATTAVFVTCILFLTGCGNITGKWTLDSITPETQRQHFDMKCLVLNQDNTFKAVADEDGKRVEMSGTYTYEKDTKTLTFTPAGGPPRAYTAQVELNGKMKVCPTDKAEWTAYLKPCSCPKCCGKGPACGCKCGKCDGKCAGKCGCNDCKCANKCAKPADKACPKTCPRAKECKPAEKKPEACPMHKEEPVKADPNKPKN